MGVEVGQSKSHAFWGYSNPEITKDIIQGLPKTDLHCRIDGSVSLQRMWEEIQTANYNVLAKAGVGDCKTLEVSNSNTLVFFLLFPTKKFAGL